MGIFNRISDIVNSNINAMLDRAEDPEKLVRLIILEMEDTLAEIKAGAASQVAERIRLERELERAAAKVQDWDQKAQLAVSKGREDLAREALEQKVWAAQHELDLTSRLKEIAEQVESVQGDITRLQEKLELARQKQGQIAQQTQRAMQRQKVEKHIYQVQNHQAFARLERIEGRLDRINAETEILSHMNNNNLDQKFRDLEWQGAIDKELEALKARMAEPASSAV
ncbi:MAG: PspA/IM30 family protein [Acidobacteria bacterium]|nr:PspA/IM30 family protein [Acidobacteriota bacterium]